MRLKRFKFTLNVATPPQFAPNKAMKEWIKSTGAPVVLGTDPEAAVKGVDCVVTDTWVSMGDKEGEHRHNVLKPYQVNEKLMSLAKPDAIFMHCLPAPSRRGSHRRGDRRPAIGGVRRSRKSPARAKGHFGLVLRAGGVARPRARRLHSVVPAMQGPIRRGLSFSHGGRSLLQQPAPGVMGPCVRRDDNEPLSFFTLRPQINAMTSQSPDIKITTEPPIRAPSSVPIDDAAAAV